MVLAEVELRFSDGDMLEVIIMLTVYEFEVPWEAVVLGDTPFILRVDELEALLDCKMLDIPVELTKNEFKVLLEGLSVVMLTTVIFEEL